MTQVGILQSVQVGTPHHYGVEGAEEVMARAWETSFFRTPSTQPRRLYVTHLEGNEQADTKNHGSLSQAVLLYAAASTSYAAVACSSRGMLCGPRTLPSAAHPGAAGGSSHRPGRLDRLLRA